MDEVQELKKELQEMRMLLEIEKQKNAKMQKEMEIAQRKMSKEAPSMPSVPKVVPRVGPNAPVHINMGDTPVTSEELSRLEAIVTDTQAKLDKIEHEKWEVQKKNIELKENLQRLKVQGSNYKKDIESTAEKVDRKENQNFKVRLELTDLKRELSTAKEELEAQEKVVKKFDKQIAEIQVQVDKLEIALKEEVRKRDKVTLEYNRARDLLAQYENHWLAKLYNK
jgi:chromosome segregation ATPase